MAMLRGITDTLVELFQMLWMRRLWWLIPMMFVLVIFGLLIALGSSTGAGPFIYTLF